jgi:three-Cys-motif partner protein
MAEDAHPEHWSDYTNLQHVKHELIREYLNGWFPKLGLWSGRVYYFDTHAGRGKYASGEAGSPVVAIDTLLRHSFRDRILKTSEVHFFFIEDDVKNVEALRGEVASLGQLPKRVHVHFSCDDCFPKLEDLLTSLLSHGKDLPPAFVFVDPYSFKVPGDIIRRLLSAGRVEVFINVIWRELDMAIAQARDKVDGGMVEMLNAVFGGEQQWRAIAAESSIDSRADQTIDLLRNLYGARWATSIRMLGDNQVTRYVLAHFTNHEAGRDLMKDCMWAVCPDGGFYARRSDNPKQTMLIEVEPNLAPLEEWLNNQLEREPLRWSILSGRIRNELWRNVHLSQVIRKRRREGAIIASGFMGRFSENADPLLSLSVKEGD